MCAILLLFLQTLFCMQQLDAQKFPNVEPIYEEIKGLPSHQQGFVLTHPNYQRVNVGVLSADQLVIIKAQEDFRRAVAEANKIRSNLREEIRSSEELPTEAYQLESQTKIPEPSGVTLEQQLPLVDQHVQLTTSASSESHNVPESESHSFQSEINSSDEDTSSQQDVEQVGNAKYFFKTAVSDTVNDNSQIRQESRDGQKLKGLYSYSDGYFKRTVHYVADENGYRVVKEESEPIGRGPHIDPSGKVDVDTQIAGSSLQYTIRGENLPTPIHTKIRN